jgi:hypothetical protein
MKLLAAIMFLLFAAQPAAAGCCDMYGSDMADHAGMQHDMGGDDAGHDCCDSDDGDRPDSDSSAPCGSCAQVVPVLPVLTLVPLSQTLAVIHIRGPDAFPAFSPSNLYRPPRSIS